MTINEIMIQLNQDFLNFAIQMSGDVHQGSDLVQDAFVKAIEGSYVFFDMTPHQVKAWFFRTMKNKYIDEYRKNERRRKLMLVGLETPDFQDERVLRLMLDVLSSEERKIVHMKYFGGYNSSEIAGVIQMNASTVRNRLSSALTKLRLAYRETS